MAAEEASPAQQNGSKKPTSPEQSNPEKPPTGGFDKTPLPRAPPGYTVKITFHRATNLPVSDVHSLSSDPYVSAQIHTSLRPRHKEDPYLRRRTPTVHRNTNPEWNFTWIVANLPASGFRLKAHIYDEDPGDMDDRLGGVHVDVPSLSDDWPGIKEQGYKIRKRKGSKRAYFGRLFVVCFNQAKHMSGDLFISMELLGWTDDARGWRAYTLGPIYWIRHFSPMLGRIAKRREPEHDESGEKHSKKPERYNFQATQFQLEGPVPVELYHRYVEFRPLIKSMFTAKGIRGFLLSKGLHTQHNRVYNFSRSTLWGKFDHPCKEMTQQLLDLVHYDRGGRIFTYVLTLDAQLRFTETGKEFGIDLLSKHTMHSDVSTYIAFSGEFFIRRLQRRHRKRSSTAPATADEPHQDPPPDDEGKPTKDPSYYELVIDNDSGTYRPNAALLPHLSSFLTRNFPGLKILTLDCNADADRMSRMKDDQRARKNREGEHIVYTQGSRSRSGSLSSSEAEELEQRARGEEGEEEEGEGEEGGATWKMAVGEMGAYGDSKKARWQRAVWGRRGGGEGDEYGGGASRVAEGDARQEGRSEGEHAAEDGVR